MEVVILHGYSDSNKGDLAIVLATIQVLKQLYPSCTINLQTVFSQDDKDFDYHHRFVKRLGIGVTPMGIPSPYVDSSKHTLGRNFFASYLLAKNLAIQKLCFHIPVLSAFFPERALPLKQIRSADVILLKGGQYIYNDQGGLRGLLYLWRILFPVNIARQLNKPTVMLGQSVGPLLGRSARKMVRQSLHSAQKLIVREEMSLGLLSEIGLSANTALAPDLAFLIEPHKPRELSNVTTQLEEGRWIGLTVVNWSFPGPEDMETKRLDYENALVDVCEQAFRAFGTGIALFPQVTVRHHGEGDLDLLLRVESRLRKRGVTVLTVKDDLLPDELSYLYGLCQMLIGTRLHSCILAACAYCPVVAIRYQGFKTEGVMRGLGLDTYVHDINTVTAKELFDSVTLALGNRNAISLKLNSIVGSYRAQLLEVVKTEIDQALCTSKK